VSTVLAREIDGLRVALDLTEEWSRVSDNDLIMSVVIARREFAENYNIAAFLEEYEKSVSFVNTYLHESANLAVNFDLIPTAAIAEAAIPRSNIVFVTGEEMRRNLLGFYRVLHEANPQLVGGELPEEDFYFVP
jgi:NitT/TauT family transport system substrate-binding protein